MNEHLRSLRDDTPGVRRDLARPSLPWPDTTQAAEGLPRRLATKDLAATRVGVAVNLAALGLTPSQP